MNAPKTYKRSWKNLLLDTNYQLVFTLFMVASCALFMAGLGYLVMQEANKATTIAIQNLQGSPVADADLVAATIARLHSRLALLRWILVGVGVALSLGLFVLGIKMTHKVAGPVFKITLYVDKIANGKFDKVYNLRKGDQLVDFYKSFTQVHETLRKQQEHDVECLRSVIDAAVKDGKVADSKELAELRTLLATKEATLG